MKITGIKGHAVSIPLPVPHCTSTNAITAASQIIVEVHTDQQMDAALTALGDHLHELVELLTPWGAAIRAAHGYPNNGPHELAQAAKRP